MKIANTDNDVNLENGCTTTGASDTIVSDDDSAMALKSLATNSLPSSPSTDNSSYSGSDDETIIETDQPLFLDTPPPGNEICSSDKSKVNNDSFIGCNVGAVGGDDAMIAEFLMDTFEPQVSGCRNDHQSSTFGDVMDAGEMDALLRAEGDGVMLLPDLCL